VAMVGINSNDTATHPDDSPERMIQEAEERGYTFPYLYDETQEVAKSYRAACTPDFFLFDGEQRLVYRGQLDPSRPNSGTPVTGRDLRAALDAVLAGKDVPEPQIPSIGCNIKWQPGNEPEYFGSTGVSDRRLLKLSVDLRRKQTLTRPYHCCSSGASASSAIRTDQRIASGGGFGIIGADGSRLTLAAVRALVLPRIDAELAIVEMVVQAGQQLAAAIRTAANGLQIAWHRG
jgi:hypothetical protein